MTPIVCGRRPKLLSLTALVLAVPCWSSAHAQGFSGTYRVVAEIAPQFIPIGPGASLNGWVELADVPSGTDQFSLNDDFVADFEFVVSWPFGSSLVLNDVAQLNPFHAERESIRFNEAVGSPRLQPSGVDIPVMFWGARGDLDGLQDRDDFFSLASDGSWGATPSTGPEPILFASFSTDYRDDSVLGWSLVLIGHQGDYNANGIVDQGDLDLVLLNWGEELFNPFDAGWLNDLPNDAIDQNELDSVLLNWGSSVGLAATNVPEPTTTKLAAIVLSMLSAWRLRRQ